MKNLYLKAFVFILFLCVQVFAQRFTIMEPDIFQAGYVYSNNAPDGYFPSLKQIAALGEKNSVYANLMLLGGRDTSFKEGQEKVGTYNVVDSYGNILGIVHPFKAPNVFSIPDGDEIHDNSATAVVVLDSLNDTKNTAIVLFASLRKLIITQITINSANSISDSILASRDMQKFMWEVDGSYKVSQNLGSYTRRLALLGIGQSGADKVYYLATGNPYSKNGIYEKSGRVDFFSITENSWALLQPNTNGLASGENGLSFGENAYFGKDLAVIDNFDKNGRKALAVLLPASTEYTNSALYIFKMDNDWTPSTELPIIIAGSSKSWQGKPGQIQKCGGLGIAKWEDENTHLLVSCEIYVPDGNDGDISSIIIVKDIVLDSTGNILSSSILSSEKISVKKPVQASYYIDSNPIAIKNHKNDLHSIAQVIRRNGVPGYTLHSIAIFTLMDTDASKNFSIEAGKQEIIANIDSLFYRSGTKDFSAKTLSGSVNCKIENGNLSCLGGEKAIDSWSSIELSSKGDCDLYKVCKRKDTIFVHVHSPSKKPSTALRIPKDIVIPYYGQENLNDFKSRSYFKNPNLQSTGMSWNSTSRLNFSSVTGSLEKGLSIIPLSKNEEGIDTLTFALSIAPSTTENHILRLHIVNSSNVLYNGIPANPGKDTIWDVSNNRYIALPLSSSSGNRNIYTYDIAQDSLKDYAEIIGNYLHILKPEIADIFIAYTENGQIMYRKVHLTTEKSTPIVVSSFMQNLNAVRINGGLQINGLNGEFELRAYNFKGAEIQREKANAQGSVFVKLKQNCPQIVQIKSANEKFYLKVSNTLIP